MHYHVNAIWSWWAKGITIFSGKTKKGIGRIHEYFTGHFGRAEGTMKLVLNAKSDQELAKRLLDTYVFLLVRLTSSSDISLCFVVSDSGLQVNIVSYRLHFLKLEVLVTSAMGTMLNFSLYGLWWCVVSTGVCIVWQWQSQLLQSSQGQHNINNYLTILKYEILTPRQTI